MPPVASQGGTDGQTGLRVRQAEAGNHETLSGSRGSFSVLVLLLWAFISEVNLVNANNVI